MQQNVEIEDDWKPDQDQMTILNKIHTDCSSKIQNLVIQFLDQALKKYQKQNQQNGKDMSGIDNNINSPQDFKQFDKGSQDNSEKNKQEEMPEFYDPYQDQKNEKWVENKIKKSFNKQIVLSCPCCFVQLCYDCQQNEQNESQWRAIEVFNIRINQSKQLIPNQKENSKNNTNNIIQNFNFKQKQDVGQYILQDSNNQNIDIFDEESIENGRKQFEIFFSVECNQCGSDLGVYEADSQVYHLFQVIPSLG